MSHLVDGREETKRGQEVDWGPFTFSLVVLEFKARASHVLDNALLLGYLLAQVQCRLSGTIFLFVRLV